MAKHECDLRKLRGRIIEKFGTLSNFADDRKVAVQTISAKMSGKKEITKSDIFEWAKALEIDQAGIGVYFFTQKVPSNETSDSREDA